MDRRQTVINLLAARTSLTRERLEWMPTEELETALEKSLAKGSNMDRQEQEDRQEVIELVCVRAPVHERQQLRKTLSTYTTAELKQIEQAILSRAHAQVAEEELIRLQAEGAADQALFELDRYRQHEPQRRAQLVQDKQTFSDSAKTLRFGVNEANFSVIRSTLGPNFTTHSIQQALAANALNLSPPTQQELDEWTRQDIKAHNTALLNADIPTLRKLAREAGAQGQAAPPLDEIQRVRSATEEHYGTRYPELPDELRIGDRDELIDAAYIKRCSKEVLRSLITRYGAPQINEALRTRKSDSSPLW